MDSMRRMSLLKRVPELKLIHNHRDFQIMDKTVRLAKENNVLVGAHPSLPDRQGFGRREMIMEPVGIGVLIL